MKSNLRPRVWWISRFEAKSLEFCANKAGEGNEAMCIGLPGTEWQENEALRLGSPGTNVAVQQGLCA